MPGAGIKGEYAQDAGKEGRGVHQSIEEPSEIGTGEFDKEKHRHYFGANFSIEVFSSHHSSM